MTKICTKCEKELPATLEYFSKMTRNKSGIRGECKECQAAQNKAWYAANTEKRTEATKKWYAANRERKIEQEKQWQRDNRARVSANVSAWRKKNPEKHLENTREYRTNNRARRTLYAQKRIAKSKAVECTFTNEQWKASVSVFDNACAYCGAGGSLTQDHVVPVSLGGGYTVNNIVPACTRCNCSKGNKPMHDWYSEQAFYNSEREAKILRAVGRSAAE